MKLVACPFCGEDDFDLIGLKMHLIIFGCMAFEELDVYEGRRGQNWREQKDEVK